MTIRQTPGDADALRRRLEQILDSEDALVILADRRQVTSFARGFSVSGCQLEMIDREVAGVVQRLLRSC